MLLRPLGSHNKIAQTKVSRNLFLTVVEDGKSQIKVPARGFLFWGFFSWLAGGCCLTVCSHGPFVNWGGEAASLVSLLTMTLILSDQGPILIDSFNFSYFLIGSSPNRDTLVVRVSTCEFWGHKHSVHNNSQKKREVGWGVKNANHQLKTIKIIG